MSDNQSPKETTGGTLLAPLDRLSETLFGLFMTLTFTGTMSVSIGAGGTVRGILFAALGCNLAWGIVDATMYLLRVATERKRGQSLLQDIRNASDDDIPDIVRAVVADATVHPVDDATARTLGYWIRETAPAPGARLLRRTDFAAALAVFLTVVLTMLPPILPFVFLNDVFAAMRWSNGIAFVMLCLIGWQFDRYIGHGSVTMRLVVPLFGAILIVITIALGG